MNGDADELATDAEQSAAAESWLKAVARIGPAPRDALPPGTELAAGRFKVTRRLGRGGMGVVFEAVDHVRRERVALKMLTCADAATSFRLKQEFRALSGLLHPNLIRLHELFVSERESFFTMELVDGVSFLDHVRGHERAGFDEAALRSACGQLAAGVRAIHRVGKVHQDLKPGNVMITGSGRVVILDFGLARDFACEAAGEIDSGSGGGTPAYMAPEHAAGAVPTDASDWYAVGVMLYQALAGRLPSGAAAGPGVGEESPPRPSAIAEHVPADLEALCVELLCNDPAQRLASEALAATLAVSETTSELELQPHAPAAFVGRRSELSTLHEALDAAGAAKPVAVYVHGLSGMGKTALIDRFVQELPERSQTVVLRGRCYERERLPFNALDALIDALRRHLRTLSEVDVARLAPRDGHALLRVFPVLQAVEGLVRAVEGRALTDNPLEVRARAIGALAELFGSIAARGRLVLVIDDLQWSDIDSGVLIARLLKLPDAHALMFVGCYRSEHAERTPALQPLLALCASDSGVDARELPLGPLSEQEARQLVAALLGDAALAHALSSEAGGHPYFLTASVHFLQSNAAAGSTARESAASSLDAMLDARTQRLPDQARRVLEAVCMATRPTAPSTLALATGAGSGTHTACDVLRAANLVRAVGERGDGLVAPYHDRIRESLIARLRPEVRTLWHKRLAGAIEAGELPDLEALLDHLLGAGESHRASVLAERMAGAASSTFSFERAAELYGVALEHRRQDETDHRCVQLLLGRANALRACFLGMHTRPTSGVTARDLWERGVGRESSLVFIEAAVRARSLGDGALLTHAALESEWERRQLPHASREHDFFEPHRATLLQWALDTLPPEDSSRRVDLMSELAIVLRPSDQWSRAESLAGAAADMAERLADPEAQLIALRACALLSVRVETPPQATLALATDLLNSARGVESMTCEADARLLRLHALTEIGCFADAAGEADEVIALMSGQTWTDRHGSISHDRVLWSFPIVWKAMWLVMQGRFDAAKGVLRAGHFYAPPNPATFTVHSIAMLKGPTPDLIAGYAQHVRSKAYRQVVNPVHADVDQQRRAAREPPVTGDFTHMEMLLRSLLAGMYVDAEQRLDARTQLDELESGDFIGLHPRFNWLSTMHGVVKACVYFDDQRCAGRLYELLRPFEDRMMVLSPHSICYGSVARCLGDLAATLGLWTAAEGHFDRALRRNLEVGARPFVAFTQAGLARMLLQRGASGDQAQARTLLAQAFDTARELGMGPLCRVVEQLRLH